MSAFKRIDHVNHSPKTLDYKTDRAVGAAEPPAILLVSSDEFPDRGSWQLLIQKLDCHCFGPCSISSLKHLLDASEVSDAAGPQSLAESSPVGSSLPDTDPQFHGQLTDLSLVRLLIVAVASDNHSAALALIDRTYTTHSWPALVVIADQRLLLVSPLKHPGIWGAVAVGSSLNQYQAALEAVISRYLTTTSARQRQLVLEQQLIDRDQLVAIALHDSRSAIGAIQSYSHLMERLWGSWPDEQQLAYVKRIGCLAEKTLAEFGDLTVLIEADAGRLRFDPTWIDIAGLLQETIERCQQIAHTPCRIVLQNYLPDPWAWVDTRLLRLIANNLLDNAVKYSPSGGLIEVFLSRTDNRLMLQVRDRGIGIAPADQERLFQQFTRGSNVSDIPGTGLGLAIVAQCVELHQGKITLESALQRGTTFTVWLPMTESQEHES
ncbi:MAG: sensor histidine kinase [Oscillatoriales cyanobacterium]|nr:MAG: sensor histidine kinase [Oscillatoriales cyanobacterium]